MRVRFSIHVFSNSRATSKKVNKPHTKKLKTKLLASKVEILREQTLQMIVTAPPLFNRDLSTLQTARYMCRKKRGIRMDLKNVIAKNRKKTRL
jgi:hypothetical protein